MSPVLARGCGTLFFLVFAVAGLAFTLVVGSTMKSSFQSLFWTKAACTIVQSQRVEPNVEAAATKANRPNFTLEYRYEFGGQTYTSRQYQPDANALGYTEIEQMLTAYPPGVSTSCWVNPKTPSEAVLKKAPFWPMLVLAVPLIFVLVGVGGIIGVWRMKDPSKAPISSRPDTAAGTSVVSIVVGPLFGLIFLGAGAALLYFLTLRPFLRIQSAKSWPEVPCQIISSEVNSSRSSKGSTTYSVHIVYSYQANGREFRSDRYDFLGISSSGWKAKNDIVARFPRGATAKCYVNPSDPTEVVLNREPGAWLLLGLLGLIFIAVGLAAIKAVFSRKTSNPSTTVGSVPGLAGIATVTSRGGPLELKSSVSPSGKFFGSLFIGLFWNGIISVFVWQIIKSWITGRPEWFLTIVMIPFVAIGLGILGYAGWMFLNLFNPRIRMMVSRDAIPLGGNFELNWMFSGSSSRIQHLRITLEAREEATYRRGTDTKTDKDVFYQLEIADTTDRMQLSQGQVRVEVPGNLMHSWSSPNNKVIWQLKVAGEIPRFPDVAEEFEITVLPKGAHLPN